MALVGMIRKVVSRIRVMKKQVGLVIMYLVAVVVANLIVTQFGTVAVLPVGFLLIGLDLTSRDYLHELWHKHLWLKMALLIGCGSLLSWLLNKDAGQIAVASFVAFVSAGVIDTITYHFLGKRSFLVRVNGSNVFSSFTDSALFLTIAFGVFMPGLILAQFGVKVAGGFLWSLALRKFRERDVLLSRNAQAKPL